MMKSIHAVYEKGVFRPTVPVELPDNCEVELTVSLQSDSEESKTPLQRLADIADQFPENSDLPVDLAAQHDHYLYGTPKRP